MDHRPPCLQACPRLAIRRLRHHSRSPTNQSPISHHALVSPIEASPPVQSVRRRHLQPHSSHLRHTKLSNAPASKISAATTGPSRNDDGGRPRRSHHPSKPSAPHAAARHRPSRRPSRKESPKQFGDPGTSPTTARSATMARLDRRLRTSSASARLRQPTRRLRHRHPLQPERPAKRSTWSTAPTSRSSPPTPATTTASISAGTLHGEVLGTTKCFHRVPLYTPSCSNSSSPTFSLSH